MPNRKPPSPDSAFTISRGPGPVLRVSELRQRRANDYSVAKATNPWSRGNNLYTAPELKPNPVIPAARMRAFALPSRVGNRLHYPDGTEEPFPGSPHRHEPA